MVSKFFPELKSAERGFFKPLLGVFLVLFLFIIAVPYVILGKVVKPDMIGVRRNFFSIPPLLDAGFASEGLRPGLHWQIPQVSQVVLIPRGFQYIHFGGKEPNAPGRPQTLTLPTTDGSKVEMDVTLIFRLFGGPGGAIEVPKLTGTDEESTEVPFMHRQVPKHGGPQELIERFKVDVSEILVRVAQRATNELLQSLSKLSTADYYNPKLRETATINAHRRISQSIGSDGIDLWATLVRRYRYADNEIDDQIFAKNLQDQIERLNAAASRLAAAKAQTETQVAQCDANIANLEVKGQSEASVIESQAKRYEAEKKAEGDLLVATARAEVDGKRADALSGIQGADVYVARELAPLLKTLRGGIVSNVDPFDIDAWIKKLLGEEKK